jgi:penicillin G amidase
MAARTLFVLAALAALLMLPGASLAHHPATTRIVAPGLERPVDVIRDRLGVPHVFAKSAHDAYLAVGYLHAEDRLFQMDSSRRQANGTLAELLGPSAIAGDAQLRTFGLRRAATRSLAELSPESRAILDAYAKGVNAWLAANPLPSEYAALELTKAQVPAWTALDSVVITKLLAFGLSFDLGDLTNTQRLIAYQTAGAGLGFDGRKLFFEDVVRSEPFAHAASILPGETSQRPKGHGHKSSSAHALDGAVAEATERALEQAERAGIAVERTTEQGSNIFVVSGKKSASGRPMVASDPHLSLSSPAVFYEVGIDVDGKKRERLTLYGVTFPGAPAVVHGTNGAVSWGSTVNPTDVTDVYQEELVIAGGVPVATKFMGNPEPTQIFPETFRANQPGNGTADDLVVVPPSAGVPPATVVVPRRNNGPLISVTGTTGLSVQFTGFSATREVDFFRLLSKADDVTEAIDAQRYFDFGAQNWMYADEDGNIGYKTSAEIPLREDLQAGTVVGLPPYFIRNGTGGNEWIADATRAEDQALPYEVLPFAEMDGLVNPKRGWIANANQDPTGQTFDNDPLNELRPGGGIRYLTPGHADGNRNARITRRLQEELDRHRRISFSDLTRIQSDEKLHDAEVLRPFITGALQSAQTPGAPPALAALGADPKVQEAVARLAAWKFSTPTGIPEGYDASDFYGFRFPSRQAEIDASVATTIYSLWRGRILAEIVDGPLAARGLGGFLPGGDQAMTALRRLLASNGTGASGIVFFAGPAARDTAVLRALRSSLDLAASPAFAAAFSGSTNLADYRWGKLHRIVFRHPLGGPFSIPTGAGFTDLGPGLPGVATDGGFSAVDASSHNPRASTLNGFMFGSGPARRFVAEQRRSGPHAVQVIPGGESGNPSSRWFGNQLGRWLTNEYHSATIDEGDIRRDASVRLKFVPSG